MKKSIFKVFFILFLGFSLPLATGFASNLKEKSEVIHWLYVFAAKKAVVSSKGLTAKIYIQKADIKRVLTFSGRPNRLWSNLDANELLQVFNKPGNNSFKADPPNAVLLYNGIHGRIMELKSAQVKENRLVFSVKLLSGQPAISTKVIGPMQLVIDGYDASTHTCDAPCYYNILGGTCVCGSTIHHMNR